VLDAPSPFRYTLKSDVRLSDGEVVSGEDYYGKVFLDADATPGATFELFRTDDVPMPSRLALFLLDADVLDGEELTPGILCDPLRAPPAADLDDGLGCLLGPGTWRVGDPVRIHVDLGSAAPRGAAVFPFLSGVPSSAPLPFEVLAPEVLPGPFGTPVPTVVAPPPLRLRFASDGHFADEPVRPDITLENGFGSGSVRVDWGDGDVEDIDAPFFPGGRYDVHPTHVYADPGTYHVQVSGTDGVRTVKSAADLQIFERACDAAPSSSLMSGGDFDLQIRAMCGLLVPGDVRVQLLEAKQIFAWEAHTPGPCENPTPGQPTAVLTCEIKSDGRGCIQLDVQPAAAVGDRVRIGLLEPDGTPKEGQSFDTVVGADPGSGCPIGP
jgi:hypothetical protein